MKIRIQITLLMNESERNKKSGPEDEDKFMVTVLSVLAV